MKAARVNIDRAGGHVIVEGADTVFVNNQPLALEGSANAVGVVVVGGSTTVVVENRKVARKSDSLSNGKNITEGSLDTFVDPNNT